MTPKMPTGRPGAKGQSALKDTSVRKAHLAPAGDQFQSRS